MQDLLQATFLDNTGAAWLRAAGIALLVGLGLQLLRWRVQVQMEPFSQRTKTSVDDGIVTTLEATKLWFILVVALWGGSLGLTTPENVRSALSLVIHVATIVQGGIWANAALTYVLNTYENRMTAANPAAATGMAAFAFVARGVLWTVLLLLLLQNLGIQVTALITGLGIGGIAIALAVQSILGDLLASMSIIFDRPFEVGDYIIVDDYSGTVENVGLKTTRITSISGEQLVFSNSDLLASRIRNYKRMRERRIVFNIGVVYGTPKEVLAGIPSLVQSLVEAQEKTRFDRCHLKEFGDSALIFETVYFMLVPEYDPFMDVQQAINLALYEEFELQGIEFAFPTQTLHVEGLTALADS